MLFNPSHRFVAYSAKKEKITFEKAFDSLGFQNSTVSIPRKDETREAFTVPVAAIEKGIALGYRFLQDQLRHRLAKFVYQYQQRGINLQAGSYYLPTITYSSFIYLQGQKIEALRMHFVPVIIRGTNLFVYQLTGTHLNYARAKTSQWSDVFDYTVQPTLHFLKDGGVKKYKLEPFVVQSVSFGENSHIDQPFYSSPIPLEENGLLLEVSLTIVETNPAQVNTAKMVELLTDNEQEIQKRIVSTLSRVLGSKS